VSSSTNGSYQRLRSLETLAGSAGDPIGTAGLEWVGAGARAWLDDVVLPAVVDPTYRRRLEIVRDRLAR
jgi:hypothetical protein